MPTSRFPRSLARELSLELLALHARRKRGQDESDHQLFYFLRSWRPDPLQPDPCKRRRAAAADDATPRNAVTLLHRFAAMPPTAHSATTPLPGTSSCFVVTKARPTGASLSSTFAITQSTLQFEAPAAAAITAGIMLASDSVGT